MWRVLYSSSCLSARKEFKLEQVQGTASGVFRVLESLPNQRRLRGLAYLVYSMKADREYDCCL